MSILKIKDFEKADDWKQAINQVKNLWGKDLLKALDKLIGFSAIKDEVKDLDRNVKMKIKLLERAHKLDEKGQNRLSNKELDEFNADIPHKRRELDLAFAESEKFFKKKDEALEVLKTLRDEYNEEDEGLTISRKFYKVERDDFEEGSEILEEELLDYVAQTIAVRDYHNRTRNSHLVDVSLKDVEDIQNKVDSLSDRKELINNLRPEVRSLELLLKTFVKSDTIKWKDLMYQYNQIIPHLKQIISFLFVVRDIFLLLKKTEGGGEATYEALEGVEELGTYKECAQKLKRAFKYVKHLNSVSSFSQTFGLMARKDLPDFDEGEEAILANFFESHLK